MDIIKENPQIPWNYTFISMNPNLTIKFIKENFIKTWRWDYISCNENITWENIQENINFPWSWTNIGKNPNITWDIIRKNPNYPWYYRDISHNKDIFDISNERIRKYFAVKTIWRYWFRANTDPTYLICQKRLLYEFQQSNY